MQLSRVPDFFFRSANESTDPSGRWLVEERSVLLADDFNFDNASFIWETRAKIKKVVFFQLKQKIRIMKHRNELMNRFLMACIGEFRVFVIQKLEFFIR